LERDENYIQQQQQKKTEQKTKEKLYIFANKLLNTNMMRVCDDHDVTEGDDVIVDGIVVIVSNIRKELVVIQSYL